MEERVEVLERELNRLKLFALAITGVLILSVLTAFGSSGSTDGVIRARGLVIVDESGRERILLGAPIPDARNRVRTDLARVRDVWAGRFPDPDQYMGYYDDYRHETNGLVILDENGFDRLALGDPVPDPNIGRRIGPATGMVVNDEQGFERSGYGLLKVGEHYRVVLGLDSANGEEGLVLALFDEGGLGVMVRNGQESLFLGNSPPGSAITGMAEPFHGLLLKDGGEVMRAISAGQQR